MYAVRVSGHTIIPLTVLRGLVFVPDRLLTVLTRPDASIREITGLIQGVIPAAKRRNGRLSFAFVYPDSQGKQVVRQVGARWTYGVPQAGS